MPADFEQCVANGGRVRTKSLSDGRYVKICYVNGKSYAGEVHEPRGEKLKKVTRA